MPRLGLGLAGTGSTRLGVRQFRRSPPFFVPRFLVPRLGLGLAGVGSTRLRSKASEKSSLLCAAFWIGGCGSQTLAVGIWGLPENASSLCRAGGGIPGPPLFCSAFQIGAYGSRFHAAGTREVFEGFSPSFRSAFSFSQKPSNHDGKIFKVAKGTAPSGVFQQGPGSVPVRFLNTWHCRRQVPVNGRSSARRR